MIRGENIIPSVCDASKNSRFNLTSHPYNSGLKWDTENALAIYIIRYSPMQLNLVLCCDFL